MPLGEAIVAGIVLAVCAAMLLRLAVGAERRARLDRSLQRAWARGPQTWWLAWQRRQRQAKERREAERRQAEAQRMEADAQRETRDVIARARQTSQHGAAGSGSGSARVDAEVDGNVIRPRAFKGTSRGEPGATHPGNDTLH
jgi:hypothetical protein